ncbi:MAG: winged helix-turn-helix transcriptional regulator, partial [Candidatus Heimdallarchaeota archaeon]|nr:winged helix-turn-helix transcriptional regulator [Candidatus Heimdallarchaeota archaeon]
KVLSERLKEMIKAGYVQKLVINMIPLKIKYQLSMQGYELKNILFEIARFGLLTQQNGVTENIDPEKIKQMRKYFEL